MAADTYFSWRDAVQFDFSKQTEVDRVTLLIEQHAKRLGFDFYVLFIRHPVPFTRPKTFYYCNLPEEWINFYFQKNYSPVDPILRNCHFPGSLWVWDDESAGEGAVMMQAARQHGIYHGISTSAIAQNRATGILSFASSDPFNNVKLTTELELKLQYLVELSLAALTRLNDISMVSVKLELSDREREILKWTAEGKTSAEISLILSISQHTVNFHQKNMQKRLNAPNKTQIASYAAAIGLI
ncbi:transcriptional regulator SdiA [Erwinia sp. JUb26]|uniref:transcriptional regulator SdiA n=1 Tax=Erwinia sp. JUb26 TaxID=2485126 RepID=UPI000F49D73A|nr:transcriptional regulator SdiA [Erwinia sp. JUb26]